MTTPETCKHRLENYLRDHEVAYAFEHHPLAYTARAVAASEHLAAKSFAKTVVVVADGQPCVVVVPASSAVHIGRLAHALGVAQARLAQELEFEPIFQDCELGAMPPFGNLYGLPVYVDASLAEDDSIAFNAGTHTDTIQIKYTDFLHLVNPTIVEVARDWPV
jgi:Ala-tRNA(Pro) deacylase